MTTLIDYIHLNPARAGLADEVGSSVMDYRWSILGSADCVSPGKRVKGMAVGEGLDPLGERDRAAGRRRWKNGPQVNRLRKLGW